MADWTAITGIVVSGVVGPSVLSTFALVRLRREHASSRVLSDRAELRGLLDEAEQDLRLGLRWAGAMQSAFFAHGRSVAERSDEEYEKFRQAGRTVDRQAGRLALRLGRDNAVTASYNEGSEAIQSLAAVIHAAAFEERLKTTYDEIEAAVNKVRAAHDRFLTHASALARSELQLSKRRQ